MEANDIQVIRKEASRSFFRLSDPATTVYAVAHARRENSAIKYDSDDIIERFSAILPRQLEAIEGAVDCMKKRVIPKDK
jgi:hypothetical protein